MTQKLSESILSSILGEPDNLVQVVDIVGEKDFPTVFEQKIFRVILECFEAGQKPDAVTVYSKIQGEDRTVQDKLNTLVAVPPVNALRIRQHAMMLREKSILRELGVLGGEITQQARAEDADPHEVMTAADKRLMELQGSFRLRHPQMMNVIVGNVSDEIDNVRAGNLSQRFVPTGYHQLDRYINGCRNGDLIIVAGRPSHGKTAMALGMAENMAEDAAVGFFSLEMSRDQLAKRLCAAESGIEYAILESGKFGEDQFDNYTDALKKISKLRIIVDDTSAISLLELRAKALRMKTSHNIRGIVIDYLQLMSVVVTKKNTTRDQDIGQITRGLKELARELDIPIVALSQLNRAVEYRSDKRPILADLRESGSVEQDADVVIFVHRPELYGITDEDGKPLPLGYSEFILAKQRNGRVGLVDMEFQKERMRFVDVAHSNFYPQVPVSSQERAETDSTADEEAF